MQPYAMFKAKFNNIKSQIENKVKLKYIHSQ